MKYFVIIAMACGCLSFEAECGNFFEDIGKKARRETKRVLKQAENTGQRIGKEIVRGHNRLDGFVKNEVVPVTESVIEDIKKFANEEMVPALEQAGRDIGHAAEQSGKELKKAAIKTGKEIARGHDRLDGFVENEVVPVTESVIEDIKRFASEEVAPTLEQAGKDVGHAAEQSGKELKKAAIKTGKEIVRGHDRLDGFVEKAIDQAEDKIQKANDELNRFRKSAENKAMEHLREKSPTVRTITKVDDFINRHSRAIKFTAISASAVAIAALVNKYSQQFLDLQYFQKFLS